MDNNISSIKEYLVSVKNLKKYYPLKKGVLSRISGYLKAVDNITFSIKKGEILGLVGESGCGKTTVGRCILRLVEPTEGYIWFNGADITNLKGIKLREIRKNMQIVFQDPDSSLNPRMSVGAIIGEALQIHHIATGKQKSERIRELLSVVGLEPNHMNRYPHEFSGGQKQRIGIARAIALNPKFIIADEPVSALDVSIQAQIINLLYDLQELYGLTYLFIAHDLSLVRHISDRVIVMFQGKIVEIASTVKLFEDPKHPYTQFLLASVPIPDPSVKREKYVVNKEIDTDDYQIKGCYFYKRCPCGMDVCKDIQPELQDLGNGHFVACHIAETAHSNISENNI
ncbi:MAG: hypothetical protein A2161_09505 [Candidatus Schekmanbacteria bacterium RBG_13_48_7]|uniref:ABC transporter domain-containing protein n=1 Tax=Candidatus Schekmanbacteria bacterium RBG_13_48_7 TaxID=1817878 RepID=A0A1F7RIU7_9BACT|nr:MAG: hypothetical protein A2161_09505 [Candidatus Schekmanbacteria bacterium RBG_13_48_7]